MAINPLDPTADDEENAAKGNQIDSGESNPGGNEITSGESANISGGEFGGAAPAAGANQKNASGSFTNLNQYIEANKDQGAGLGGKLQSNVQKSAGEGLQNLNTAQQEFGAAQKQAGLNPDDYSVEKVQQVASKNDIGQSDIEKFNTARTKSQALQSGSDSAPKALTDTDKYQTAKQGLTKAADKAQLTGTESGRETLLKESFARPDYNKGQSSLDQLLTQNVPQNRQRFDALRNSLLGQYGLASQDAQAVQKAADLRNQTVEQAKTATGNIQTGVNNVLNPYQQELLSRPDQLNQQQSQSFQNSRAALKDYLQQTYGNSPFGANIDSLVDTIIKPQSTLGGATLQNTVGQQDYQRLANLNALAGNKEVKLGDKIYNPKDFTGDFKTGQNFDYAAGNNKYQESVNRYKNATTNQVNETLKSTPLNIMGRPFAGIGNAIDYVTSSVAKHDFYGYGQPEMVPETQKLVDSVQGQLDKVNAIRNQYGLSQLSGPSSNRINDLRKDIIAQTINTKLQGRVDQDLVKSFLNSGGQLPALPANASQVQKMTVDFLKNDGNTRALMGQDANKKDNQQLNQIVNNAAKARALQEYIQNIGNNPLQNIPSSQIGAGPGDFTGSIPGGGPGGTQPDGRPIIIDPKRI